MFFMCFACFIDRFVNFRKVSFSFSKVTSQYKKEEYISSVEINFQISCKFIFRDIHVCILSIRCFLCVLHVLLTDSSIFARFHWVSVKSNIPVQERRIHFQSSDQFSNLQLVYFQRYTRLYPVNTTFFVCFACFIDRFVNFRKVSFSFSKSNIIVQERRIHFQCRDQFSNLQLVYFQRYTRLYPVNTMFFMCFACFIDRFVNFRKVSFSFSKVTSQYKKEEYISSVEINFQISC